MVSLHKLEPSVTSTSIPKVIMRAEQTFSGLMKTLNADCSKIMEALLNMLNQVLAGKTFDLIMAVASVEGKLKAFVSRMIKFNEYSKQVNEPVPGKGPSSRAMLFDVTFLMLYSIVQTYGPEVLEEGGDSFFEQWVRECMPERCKPKSPHKMLQTIDSTVVDVLLQQINSGEPDFMSSTVKWDATCMAAMGVVKELLFGWESGGLSAGDVKRALDRLRNGVCCLSICAATWLCAHMSIAQQDSLLKPMNMVQPFLTPGTNEETQDAFIKER